MALHVALVLALAAAAAAAREPCPEQLAAPVRAGSRTLATAGGAPFQAPLWSDGSRACPCLRRGCLRKCCPPGLVSDQWGDCVPAPAEARPAPPELAALQALFPRVVAVVEQMQNVSDGPGDAQPDELIRNLSSALFLSLPSGTSRPSSDDGAPHPTTPDRQLSTARLREAAEALSSVLSNVASSGTPGLAELRESLANISRELSGAPGSVASLLSLLAGRTDAPLHGMFVLFGSACPCSRYEIDDPFEMLENGTLMFDSYAVPVSEYCLDETAGGNLTVYLCFPADECPQEEKDAVFFYPAGTVLSLPFLAATFAVYALFQELRNRVGAALMCYVAALFVAYALLAAVQLSMGYVSVPFCLAAAFIIYFSFLASFFWLNVMCFDIFWTFSGFRSLRGTAREREHKKFIIYSIYSWGCPLILLCVTLIMQFHNDIPDSFLKPKFGEKKCWFHDDLTLLAYFYGPVGILVLCNIILFIFTAIRIAQLKRETAMLKGTDSRRHDDDNRQRFNLYLKLFLVMGVNWSMEVISGVVGGPEYVWYVTDICNTLQGVLIFVIFVWKDRIRRMLMEKFCPKRASTKLSKSTVVTYSTRTSPSRLSHGVLNNKVTDTSNGDVKITAITHISDDSDVP